MLVLTRKAGERICIGDEVSIMVLSISGRQVRLGIDAPKSLIVRRSELCDEIKGGASAEEGSDPVAVGCVIPTDAH
jgi:carbon storage regulator